MLGQVQYINQTNIISNWKLGEALGIPFERHIYKVLSRQMEQYNGKVRVYDTPGSRDDGKDIIIESSVDIHDLMGHDFYLRGKSKMKIYVECKSSDSGKISWNQLAGNIARIENDNIQYYVVVTNTTLVPFTYFQFSEAAKKEHIEFFLVDQTLLIPYLNDQKAFIGNVTSDASSNYHDTYSEYQVLSYEQDMQTTFEIYFLIRNYKTETSRIKIKLGTDHDWTISPSDIDIVLAKNQFRCIKMIAKRNYFDGINQLNLIFQQNDFKNVIEVKGMNLDFDFIPPLHGKQHYEVLDSLSNLITSSTDYRIKCMVGEAGCGKSRIINELYKRISGRNVVTISVNCTRNEANFKKVLIKKLVSKDLIRQPEKDMGLVSIIEQIDTEFQKCVLIFEDIHNLTESLEELKNLVLMNYGKAITIILIGRDDYSVGTLEYFSFLQWFHQKRKADYLEIKNLKSPDDANLIRSIISDVPDFVLRKLLSKSHSNPLFIVQFIEYLLEINLAHIINRTTVGILNIDTFSTRNYIPDTIEKLYKDRCNILKTMPEGNSMINFLYLASFVGQTFSKEIAISYFEDDSQTIDTLINRKFLVFSADGNLSFFHETLFLYFRNSLINGSEIRKSIWNDILNFKKYLNELDQGIAYFYHGDYHDAANSLKTVLMACESMENYSSVNVNRNYYEYLDTVYKLAKVQKNLNLQKKIIIYKIYTALHYYSPMTAIKECVHAAELTKDSAELMQDELFVYSITELKAHAYMNAGQLKNSERYLTECLTISLLHPDRLLPGSRFDMYDRLAGLYIKYNHFLLADNYNKLSAQLAAEIGDESLLALVLITKAKLNFYINPELSQKLLKKAANILGEKSSSRIYCHNQLSTIIQQLPLHMNDVGWISDTKSLVDTYRQTSLENNYGSSIIRSHLLLAVLEFLSNKDAGNFEKAEQFISHGIDASIKFGVATYIWEFYNLKLIIASRLHKDEEYIMKIVETIKRMLKQQNLFYLGTLDFCYANILVLTNIGKYLSHENEFYQFMNSISYNNHQMNSGCNFDCDSNQCLYVCERDLKRYKAEFENIHSNHLLLMNQTTKYDLLDEITGYYIAIS